MALGWARWHIEPGGCLAFCERADEVPRFGRQADAIGIEALATAFGSAGGAGSG